MSSSSRRGFTLIELMIAVAIVGILASVAIPEFSRASFRTKKAERDLILDGVGRGVQAIIVRDGKFPSATFEGNWNPSVPPGTSKRPFEYGAAAWRDVDVIVEGAVYHQYYFVGQNATQSGGTGGAPTPMMLDAFAKGDLDGDGVAQQRNAYWEVREGALLVRKADEFSPADDVAF